MSTGNVREPGGLAAALRQDPDLSASLAAARDGLGYVRGRVDGLLGPAPGMVLEVDGGTGGYALHAARRGSRVAAVDPALAALRHLDGRARSDGARPVAPVRAVPWRLPFAGGAFDAAVSLWSAWPAGTDLSAAVREIERTVRPGGCVAVVRDALDDEYERLWPAEARGALRAAEAEAADALRAAGYDDEAVETAFVFATVDEAERTLGGLLGPQAAAYIATRLMYDHVSPTVAHRARVFWKRLPAQPPGRRRW